ncbi:glycosyltransferase [Candidatus Omnitrophota bacterium]
MTVWWITCFLGWVIFYEWIRRAATTFWFFGTQRLTKKAAQSPTPANWPSVSVIVPARNEEQGIEGTLRSLLKMDYPDFEVIAVDDRSQDQTGAILRRLAEQEQRLKVVHNRELPENWLGKQYAIHQAAQTAKGDFILLTDADVLFNKKTLRLAIKYALGKKLDHLVLLTSHIPGKYWENALWTFFIMLFMMHRNPKAVSTCSKKYSIGLGQFNLVKKTAYQQAGGDEAIRLKIPQDMNLGRLLKCSGARQDVLLGSDLIRLKWFRGVNGFMKITEKNAYATLNFSLKELSSLTGFYLAVAILPYIVLLSLHDARSYGYVFSVLMIHILHGYVGQKLQCGWRVLLVSPFCIILYLSALWRSAYITIRQRGIRWRGRFYSLKTLRSGK